MPDFMRAEVSQAASVNPLRCILQGQVLCGGRTKGPPPLIMDPLPSEAVNLFSVYIVCLYFVYLVH